MAQAKAQPGTSNRGFAAMDGAKQRAIARKGGQSVPNEKRSFSQNRALASEAGRKGGQNVPSEKRSFAQNRDLAAAAGREGGHARSNINHAAGPDPEPESFPQDRDEQQH